MLADLGPALVVTRREVRDHFRDWRILGPMLLLILILPIFMNYASARFLDFADRYGAHVEAGQIYPFLLMVVGFFPITVALVLALESFVGEKERRSLEPLLSSPLSDFQIYFPAGHLVSKRCSNIADCRPCNSQFPDHGKWRGGGVIPNNLHAGGKFTGSIHHHPHGDLAPGRECSNCLVEQHGIVLDPDRRTCGGCAADPHRCCSF
jgi:hypothetical protein